MDINNSISKNTITIPNSTLQLTLKQSCLVSVFFNTAQDQMRACGAVKRGHMPFLMPCETSDA